MKGGLLHILAAPRKRIGGGPQSQKAQTVPQLIGWRHEQIVFNRADKVRVRIRPSAGRFAY